MIYFRRLLLLVALAHDLGRAKGQMNMPDTLRFLDLGGQGVPNPTRVDQFPRPFDLNMGPISVGGDTYETVFVHEEGILSFGDPLANPSGVDLGNAMFPSLFVFRYHSDTTNFMGNIRINAYSARTPSMRMTENFIRFQTANMNFNASLLILVEWRGLRFQFDESMAMVDFQLVVVSDNSTNRTYAIFTYNCTSSNMEMYMNSPDPISATIGINIPGVTMETFRYSDTPYAVEVRCLNAVAGTTFTNLIYDLNPPPPIPNPPPQTGSEQNVSTCRQRCCEPFNDPTESCAIVEQGQLCYCDALCFERDDCCPSIIGLLEVPPSCIPTCQHGTVNLQGSDLYTTGPPFMCFSGVPLYINSGQFVGELREEEPGFTPLQNTIVTCSQLLNQENVGIEESSPEMRQMYLRGIDDLSCTGTEDSLFDCDFEMEIEGVDVIDSLADLDCSSFDDLFVLSDCNPTEVGVRLNDAGEVRICAGLSVRVCGGNFWNANSAAVVCQELGFNGVMDYDTVIRNIPVDYLPSFECTGSEAALEDCILVDDPDCFLTDMVASVTCSLASSPRPGQGSPPVQSPPAEEQNGLSDTVIGLIVGSFVIVFMLVSTVVIIVLCVRLKRKEKQITEQKQLHNELELPRNDFQVSESPISLRYVKTYGESMDPAPSAPVRPTLADVNLVKTLQGELLISASKLKLMEVVGRGEFGVVYRAQVYLENSDTPTYVAAKTVSGAVDKEEVDELLRESLKMKHFDHPNVMGLMGVCVDAGPSPFLILPFMSGGSLLSYLKMHRYELLLNDKADESDISDVEVKLLSMCLQIAKGMECLAASNFVHRDLAARNCMIDSNGVIKVADFGLSKNTYEKMYFRQDKNEGVKLPIKWMAIESMDDAVFSEKTDVWSFGVTCWEVFSGGKQPYPGISPMSLPGMLEEGQRMEKPNNAACSDATFRNYMMQCWEADPDDRPTFAELATDIDQQLTGMAGYLDFNQFNLVTNTSPKHTPSTTDSLKE